MNQAKWAADSAGRNKNLELDTKVYKPQDIEKTPEITKKLLELDEQQLDLLTG